MSRRADLQRHEVVGEPERERADEQVHHDAAVHREELVVGAGARRSCSSGLNSWTPDDLGERAAEQEEAERRDHVADADPLVIGGGEPAEQAGGAAGLGGRRAAVAGRSIDDGHRVRPPLLAAEPRLVVGPASPPGRRSSCASGRGRRTRRSGRRTCPASSMFTSIWLSDARDQVALRRNSGTQNEWMTSSVPSFNCTVSPTGSTSSGGRPALSPVTVTRFARVAELPLPLEPDDVDRDGGGRLRGGG